MISYEVADELQLNVLKAYETFSGDERDIMFVKYRKKINEIIQGSEILQKQMLSYLETIKDFNKYYAEDSVGIETGNLMGACYDDFYIILNKIELILDSQYNISIVRT